MDYKVVSSPIGPLRLVESGGRVARVDFGAPEAPEEWNRVAELSTDVERQLAEYFRGERRDFDLPFQPRGTDFQLRVWQELSTIPYGTTTSYGEIARRIGRPKASRAVGAANGRNPIPVIVPCHRVIGANGSLVGFGGGLPIKRMLLELER